MKYEKRKSGVVDVVGRGRGMWFIFLLFLEKAILNKTLYYHFFIDYSVIV